SDSEYVFERKINLLERIHNTHGIEFVDYDISFKGICPKCREKVKEEQHG
ncbi:transcriptional repressor, partial [Dorea longicatena]|nr:transcriptional repressor [Dorea longicatena]